MKARDAEPTLGGSGLALSVDPQLVGDILEIPRPSPTGFDAQTRNTTVPPAMQAKIRASEPPQD